MANRRNRPSIPYVGTNRPFYARYRDLADNRQDLTGGQLDGDVNYIIDVLNEHDDDISGVAAGVLPGSTLAENVFKFPATDGQNPANIFWTKVTQHYFDNSSVPTIALQNECVTSEKIGNGQITESKYGPESIPNSAYQDDSIPSNAIPNNSLSFVKITKQDSQDFHEFFNEQADGFANGQKIQENSLNASRIVDLSITDGKVANGTLTRRAISPVAALHVGMIMYWPTNIAPAGWLFCNHQAVSRAQYAELFGVIGTIYGAGDGNTTFNLPDTRGLVAVSCDPSQAGGNAFAGNRVRNAGTYEIGHIFGEDMNTLTEQQMPAHTHTVPRGTRTFVAGSVQQRFPENYDVRTETDTSSSSGGGQPHNNIQPSIFIPMIIYTGVA